MKIYVIGKQWMWKVEYPGGQREIDALHVPVGRPVELIMTSEDVIHDFSVPAFRIKHDVLPGRYETLWFQADRAGTYHLFCTQLCGTGHSDMVGDIVVMSRPRLSEMAGAERRQRDTGASRTNTVHALRLQRMPWRQGAGGNQSGSTVRAPALAGLYGSPVTLADGRMVTADDRYIRDCILLPRTRNAWPVIRPSCPPSLDRSARRIS